MEEIVILFINLINEVKSLEIIDPKNNFVEDKTLVII